MKILTLLILAGRLLTVNAPANIDPLAVFGQVPFYDTTLVFGHASDAGGYAYDLGIGDRPTGYYLDGSSQIYEVTQIGAYAAQSTEIAAGGGDFLLRVDYQWMTVSEVIEMYSATGGITLMTCWPRDGQTTGRLFVELAPVLEVE